MAQDHGVRGMKTQIGPESTVATGTAAGYRARNLRSTLRTIINGQAYAGEGSKFNSTWQAGDQIGQGEWNSPAGFADIVLPFDGVFCRPVVTLGAGSSVSRVYTPNPYGPDTVRTYVEQRGNDAVGHFNQQHNGVVVNGLTLNATRRTATWKAPVFSQPRKMVDTMTASPTKIENVQFSPKDIDLFYSLISLADLDVAPIQVMRLFEYNLEFNDRFDPVNPMNSSLDSWAAFVESGDPITANLTLRLGMDVNTFSNTTAWALTTAYTKGTIRRKSGTEQANKLLFRVVTAGTSGGTEPASFTTATEGQLITDGTVTWEAIPYDYAAPYSHYDINRGTQLFLRFKANGPNISGAINYICQIDTVIQLTATPDDAQEGGLKAGTYTGMLTVDDATDKSLVATVVNKFPDWP